MPRGSESGLSLLKEKAKGVSHSAPRLQAAQKGTEKKNFCCKTALAWVVGRCTLVEGGGCVPFYNWTPMTNKLVIPVLK